LILSESVVKVWSGFKWRRADSNSGSVLVRRRTVGFIRKQRFF